MGVLLEVHQKNMVMMNDCNHQCYDMRMVKIKIRIIYNTNDTKKGETEETDDVDDCSTHGRWSSKYKIPNPKGSSLVLQGVA